MECKVWTKGVPESWKLEKICLLPKKGVLHPGCFRPYVLTQDLLKLHERCMLHQLQRFLERYIIHSRQVGFRRGHRIQEYVLHLGEILVLEGCYVVLVDFTQAIPSVVWSFLFSPLQTYNIDQCSIELIMDTLVGSKACPVVNNRAGEEIELKRGVCQGSLLSPILWNTYINPLLVKLTGLIEENGVFADDIVLTDMELTNIKRGMEWVIQCLQALHISINIQKTHCLAFGNATLGEIQVGQHTLTARRERKHSW